MGQHLQAFSGYKCKLGVSALQASHDPFSRGVIMVRLQLYKRSLVVLCLGVSLFACAPPGRAQDNARKVVKKAPVPYPAILRSKGIGGVVKLKVFVKADGTVRDTEVLGGNPILAESAQKSVMLWKFSPASSETVLELSVVFDPHGDSGS